MIREGDDMIKFRFQRFRTAAPAKGSRPQPGPGHSRPGRRPSPYYCDQDKSDLADASFNVEKAKLEVSKQEIVGELQAAESRIDLGLCEQEA